MLMALGWASVAAGADPMDQAPVGSGNVSFRPGDGLRIESDDGRFALQSRWRVQVRYVLSAPETDLGQARQAFQLRRARWSWSGWFFGEQNRFKLDLNLAPQDLDLGAAPVPNGPLRDAFVEFTHLRDLELALGQMKIGYSRQFDASSGDLMLVDRSIVHDEFSLDRDLGLQVGSEDLGGAGVLGYSLGLFSGEGPYSWRPSDFGMAYAARIDLMPTGPFRADEESDQARSETPELAVGFGAAFVDEAKRDRGVTGDPPADGGTTDTLHATSDVAFRYAGVSVDLAGHWRDGTRHPGPGPGPAPPPRDGVGVMVQAGWLLPRTRFEPSARWARVVPTTSASGLAPRTEVGVGGSWYVAEHAFKVQADLFRRWAPGSAGPAADLEARVQLQASI